MNVVLLDYGAGNVASVAKALAASGARPRLTNAPDDVRAARAVVIPGVGHFEATAAITPAMREAIRASLDRGAYVLGICLGLHWLFEGSAEAPPLAGLGVFPGRCRRLEPRADAKVPHVGWNTLDRTARPSVLLAGLPAGAMAYFTHSYAAPPVPATTATTSHAGEFSAVVESNRVFGVQCHPEKSGRTGLRILANFLVAAGSGR